MRAPEFLGRIVAMRFFPTFLFLVGCGSQCEVAGSYTVHPSRIGGSCPRVVEETLVFTLVVAELSDTQARVTTEGVDGACFASVNKNTCHLTYDNCGAYYDSALAMLEDLDLAFSIAGFTGRSDQYYQAPPLAAPCVLSLRYSATRK